MDLNTPCLNAFKSIELVDLYSNFNQNLTVRFCFDSVRQQNLHEELTHKTKRILLRLARMSRQSWIFVYNCLIYYRNPNDDLMKSITTEDVNMYLCKCDDCIPVKKIYLSYINNIPHVSDSLSKGSRYLGNWVIYYCGLYVAEQKWMVYYFKNVESNFLGYKYIDTLVPRNLIIIFISEVTEVSPDDLFLMIEGRFRLKDMNKKYSFRRVSIFIASYNLIADHYRLPKIHRSVILNKNMKNRVNDIYNQVTNKFKIIKVDKVELRRDLFRLIDTNVGLTNSHVDRLEEIKRKNRHLMIDVERIYGDFKEKIEVEKSIYDSERERLKEKYKDITLEVARRFKDGFVYEKIRRFRVDFEDDFSRGLEYCLEEDHPIEVRDRLVEKDRLKKVNNFDISEQVLVTPTRTRKIGFKVRLEKDMLKSIDDYVEETGEKLSQREDSLPYTAPPNFKTFKMHEQPLQLMPDSPKINQTQKLIVKEVYNKNLVDTNLLYRIIKAEILLIIQSTIKNRRLKVEVDLNTLKMKEKGFIIGLETGGMINIIERIVDKNLSSNDFYNKMIDLYNKAGSPVKELPERLYSFFIQRIIGIRSRKKRINLLKLSVDEAIELTSNALMRNVNYIESCKKLSIKGGLSRSFLKCLHYQERSSKNQRKYRERDNP
jgi:hypothetical protein